MSYDITDDLERARHAEAVRIRAERDRLRAEVDRLTDGIRGALDKLDSMAWVDASHIGDGYASLVTVEDYYVQEEAEDALWSLLDVAGDDGEGG